ncbi:unnamed protein product [Schistosoma mattheei]|uniref:Uncharacterized protein n=1 Tax=Schistosoma mattheei TaxID=31246 RepID=A0A183PQF2_9TREM|nr:unnamed protein product [Schistosoma mattheei]
MMDLRTVGQQDVHLERLELNELLYGEKSRLVSLTKNSMPNGTICSRSINKCLIRNN